MALVPILFKRIPPRRIIGRVVALICVLFITSLFVLYCYDHDALKSIPILGRLPWHILVGNTALQPETHLIIGRQQVLDEAARKSPEVVFLGDSLTANWALQGLSVWNSQFSALNAVQVGAGGDRIQNLLDRIRSGEFDRFSPKVAVLLIGTNNVNRNEPDEIVSAIDLVVTKLKRMWPQAQILVLAIPPRELPRSKLLIDKIDKIDLLLGKRLATSSNVTFIDNHRDFLGSDGWIDRRLYTSQGVHLTVAGYRILANAIRKPLAQAIDKVNSKAKVGLR